MVKLTEKDDQNKLTIVIGEKSMMVQESLKVNAPHDTLGFALLTTEDPERGKEGGEETKVV